MTTPDLARPLLVNGERLARNVERVSGGGGKKFHPQTIDEARALLGPMARNLASAAIQIPDSLRSERLIFQATLLPNYLANSYYPTALLEAFGLAPLGSRRTSGVLRTAKREPRAAPTKSLILAGSDAAIQGLADLVDGATNLRIDKTATAALENVRQFSEIRLSETDEVVRAADVSAQSYSIQGLYEAVLHPSPERSRARFEPLEDELYQKWEALVETQGGRVLHDYRQVVGGLTFVAVSATADALPDLAAFNLLRAIRPLPQMQPLPAPAALFRAHAAASFSAPPAATISADAPSVAIIDGGIDVTSPFFGPFARELDTTGQAPLAEGIAHGSVVTGACLYGDVSAAMHLSPVDASIDHYRVFPCPAGDPDVLWVLDQIKSAVNQRDYQVVNLSLGPEISVEDDDEPHVWTATLDELAYERDVLFVVAAGNNGGRDAAAGLNRVQVPADMVNGLTVGASDALHPSTPWNRAPYSAVGPGRSGARLQPAGLTFGGTTGSPFHGLAPDGTKVGGHGTSYAAPLMTNLLTVLSSELGPHATPNSLRALAIHSAIEHDGAHDWDQHGNGRFPTDARDLLECEANEARLLYQGSVARNEVLALPLPLPDQAGAGRLTIRWALAVLAPTDPTEALEYTRAAIDIVFRPHSERRKYSKQGQRTLQLDALTDALAIAEALAEGFVPSVHPTSKPLPGSTSDEVARREGGKWETLRAGKLTMNSNSLFRPRFDLSQLARRGGLETDVPDLPYAVESMDVVYELLVDERVVRT